MADVSPTRAPRFPAHIAVRYRSENVELVAKAHDISTSGVYVSSEVADQPGTEGMLEFHSYLSRDPVEVRCKVSRNSTIPTHGMGLQFIEPDERSQSLVQRYTSLFANERRVVMVDDDPALLRMMGRFLSREAIDFVGIDLPVSTDAVLERFKPNMIILDIMMPRIDGGTLARRLRQNPRTAHIPIVFYSAASPSILPAELQDLPFIPKGSRRADAVEIICDTLDVQQRGGHIG